MRKFTYWLCFALVAFAAIYAHGVWALWNLGVRLPYTTALSLLTPFGKLTPQMLAPHVPAALIVGLNFVVLLLVFRRLWLMLAKRQGVPHSYSGVAKVLGYVGAWSFVLAAVGLLLSILIRAGSGVPAAMLAWPALFCVPWAFAIAEVMSFRPAVKSAA
ncbi:MAG: hypothetical protein U1F45_18775 [Burkholderiales bacterium]